MMVLIFYVWALGAVITFLGLGYAIFIQVSQQLPRFLRLSTPKKLVFVSVLIIFDVVVSVLWPIAGISKAIKKALKT